MSTDGSGRSPVMRAYGGHLSVEAIEARQLAEYRLMREASAERVTAFINAGPNWWLDAAQAWLDKRIAEETARGGRSFGS